MHLPEWLYDLGCCQNEIERVDFEGVGRALVELRDRAEKAHQDLDCPTPPDEREALQEMAELLHRICDDLDEFLETREFHHVGEAYVKSQELEQIRATIVGASDPEIY